MWTPAQTLETYQEIILIQLETISEQQLTQTRQSLDKFQLFTNAALAGMKERQERQEDVLERKVKQKKDERLLMTKLAQFEQAGRDFYGCA